MGGWVDRGSQAWNAGDTRHAGSSDQVGHASSQLVYATTSTKLIRYCRCQVSIFFFWLFKVLGFFRGHFGEYESKRF